MKIHTQLLVVTFLIVLSSSMASSEETVQTFPALNTHPIVVDTSTRTCKSWKEHRQSNASNNQEDAAFIYGFFSGYNAFNQSQSPRFLPHDAVNLLNIMDRYCTNEPHSQLATVAIEVINDLHKKPVH